LSLGLARLWRLAPQMRAIGLSATVAEPESLARFLCRKLAAEGEAADIVTAGVQRRRSSRCSTPANGLPWAGHTARHALNEVYDLIKTQQDHRWFSSTPAARPRCCFRPVADERRWPCDRAASRLARCGAAPQGRGRHGQGKLRGVVCTSSLDLGVDWGDVDLVINIGAPKGRLTV